MFQRLVLVLVLLPALRAVAEDAERVLPYDPLTPFFRANMAAAQRCYQAARKKDDKLEGRILARFVVGTDGAMHDVATEEVTLHSSEVTGCVSKVIAGWHLPGLPERPRRVTWPFDFGDGPETARAAAEQRHAEENGWMMRELLPKLGACVTGVAGASRSELFFRVAPDGSAGEVRLEPPSPSDAEWGRCVVSAVQGWRSPQPPPKPTAYRVPLDETAHAVAAGATTPEAPSDKEGLGSYIKLRLRTIQQCYEKQLRNDPTLKGKVIAHFTIGTDGRVQDVRTEDVSLYSPQVAWCIRRLVQTWTFPLHPDAPGPVSFPFVFSPAQGRSPDEARGAAVRKAVLELAPKLRACLDPAETVVGGNLGDACVSFRVGADGSTSDVRVRPRTAEDDAWSRCVAARISAWKPVPTPPASTVYALPLGAEEERCEP